MSTGRSAEPPFSYHLVAPGPAWTLPFLVVVARRLALARAGMGVLIEQAVGGAEPWLTAGSPSAEQLLVGSGRGQPAYLRREPARAHLPPPGFRFREGYVGEVRARTESPPAPAARAASTREPSIPSALGPTPERPGPLDCVPPGGWAATQTHWIAAGDGTLCVWWRAAIAERTSVRAEATTAFQVGLGAHLESVVGPGGAVRAVRWRGFREREWKEGALRRFRGARSLRLRAESAARLATHAPVAGDVDGESLSLQTVVLGASGSGKTSYLAQVTRRWVESGRPAVVVDVHGDLASSVTRSLSVPARERIVAVDAGGPPQAIPGVAVLSPSAGPAAEREAAAVVAALKRLSGEGGELHWGFRLERILDVFVRLAQEEGGSLRDLHALLSDPRRREAARLTTRREDARVLLDELPGILRRNPEFLWSAAVRVSKVALVPAIAALVAPPSVGMPLERLLGEGRSVFWRMPVGQLGPEGAGFVANLLVSRLFYGASAAAPSAAQAREVLLVLDEAQFLAPRLLADVLAEGRKFGLRVVLATQFPERFGPELKAAAAGAAGTHVVFRVAPAAARAAGNWAGLSPEEAERWLPALPAGHGVLSTSSGGVDRRLVRADVLDSSDDRPWRRAVEASVQEFHAAISPNDESGATSSIAEALLLGVLGMEARGERTTRQRLVHDVAARGLEPVDPAAALEQMERLVARGWLNDNDGWVSLSAAGARYIGMSPETHATLESAEHRALLLESFRTFARHGERLEILRQGRFDTRLPDARLRLLPRSLTQWTPGQVEEHLRRRSASWAWRLSGGRDIHVEAEVSGATRPARIHRDLEKARASQAFLLVVVADAARARRVREILAKARVDRREVQVWTLTRASAARPPPTLAEGARKSD